jgi:hypothetical protein
MALFAGSDILFFGFIMFVCAIGAILYAAFEGCVYLFSSKEKKKEMTLELLDKKKLEHANSILYHQKRLDEVNEETKKVMES